MNQWFVHQALVSLILLIFTVEAVDIALAGSILQSAQELKPSNPIRGEQDIQLLELGKPIERELRGGGTHAYRVKLAADQFLHCTVDQRGIDVFVTLLRPDGKQIIEIDSPNGIQGPEPVLIIADVTGDHRLEVRSLEKDAKPGQYEVRIEEQRDATELDKKRIAAERAFMEAELLRAQESPESIRKSVGKYEDSLAIQRDLKDKAMEARTLNSIGDAYYVLDDWQKALEYFNQALPVSRAAQDRSILAATLEYIGIVYDSVGDNQNALKYYNQVLPIFRILGDHLGEAATLNKIGRVYDLTGNKQKALEYYKRALPVSRMLQDRSTLAITLNNIGAVYDSVGNKQEALRYYNQALSIGRVLQDRSVLAVTLNNVGAVYNSTGDKQEAFKHYDQALVICKALRVRSGEATTLNNIGQVYESIGDKQKALEYYSRALPIFQALQDRSSEATTLNNIGAVYDSVGDKQAALEYYSRALPILRDVENRSVEATTLNNIGLIYDSLGEKQEALKYYDQALSLCRAVQYRSLLATTLNNVGAVYSSIGDKQKALKQFNEALHIYQALRNRSSEATTLGNIGFIYDSLGEKRKALNLYKQALANIESIRASATIEEIKTGLSEHSISIYKLASLLLIRLEQYSQAFNLKERARARTFLDQIGNVRLHKRNTPSALLIQEEQTLASELASLEQSLRQERSKPASSLKTVNLSSIENQLAVKQRRYEDLLLRLKLTNPEYASLRSINTLNLSKVQTLLNKYTTLLSYFVTSEKVLAFMITRDRFRAVEIPVKEEELIKSITWFRGFASLHNLQSESLKQLYGWLIAPVKQYINTPVVGIIPHGILHYLPFAALTDGQRYFGDNYTLFYLPNASVLPFIQRKSKPIGTQVLAIAQSQAGGLASLSYADEEVETVANLFNTKAFTTGNTTKSEFMNRAEEYNIVHIAAHAELNTYSPLFTQIKLAAGKDDTGALAVHEVYRLDLSKASLVALSACETQLGTHSQGDDIVGLNRAFIYAGTPTVIASLWTVDDESTSYLMKAFYTHLKSGMGKAESLRAAQSETRKKYAHPYYWAGFVLTGDPGLLVTSKK